MLVLGVVNLFGDLTACPAIERSAYPTWGVSGRTGRYWLITTEGWIATSSDPDNNYFQLMSPM